MQPKRQSERIAVLESQVDSLAETQTKILTKQEEMLAELARYRGAFGLATIVISAVGTALFFFKDAILAKLGMK